MSLLHPFVHVVVSRLFSENCYLVHQPGRGECVIVDPGIDAQSIIDSITTQRLSPVAIFLTHGHADHIAGVQALKRCWPNCPILIGTADAAKLSDPVLNLSAQYGMDLTSPPADQLVNEGDKLELAGMTWEVFETPGHSIGHVVFLCRETFPWLVLGGDVLFREGVGRTDFADGSFEQLADSIHKKLFVLPEDSLVLPGHGPPTTIGHERAHNPFIGRRT